MIKILLADDSTHAQRMGAKILSAEGIDVIAVSNGDAAVKKLQALDIDLVLADVYMPGLDGYEVCQWVKNSADHPGLPVVLVVGALEPLVPDRIAQARADGLLKKPFEASAMMEMLRPLIDASMLAKPTRKKNEVDPEKTQAIYERTVAIPPPAPATGAPKHDETVEMEPAPATDFESTIRIPPPKGSKDIRAQDSVILAGAAAATITAAATAATAAAAAAPPESPEPEPVAAEPAAVVPAAAPPDDLPAMLDASMTDLTATDPGMHETAPPPMEDFIPDMGMAAEESMTEFEIPDMSAHMESHDEPAMPEYAAVPEPEPEPEPEPVATAPAPVPAAPAPTKWVAEAVEVSPVDHAKFGELPEISGKADAPPDWGELLKSVEEGTASAAPAPAPASEPTAAAAGALELEMPVEPEAALPEPVAAAPAAPVIDEEELRMSVQLCLENALPGLVDEVTAAVLRRLGRG